MPSAAVHLHLDDGVAHRQRHLEVGRIVVRVRERIAVRVLNFGIGAGVVLRHRHCHLVDAVGDRRRVGDRARGEGRAQRHPRAQRQRAQRRVRREHGRDVTHRQRVGACNLAIPECYEVVGAGRGRREDYLAVEDAVCEVDVVIEGVANPVAG